MANENITRPFGADPYQTGETILPADISAELNNLVAELNATNAEVNLNTSVYDDWLAGGYRAKVDAHDLLDARIDALEAALLGLSFPLGMESGEIDLGKTVANVIQRTGVHYLQIEGLEFQANQITPVSAAGVMISDVYLSDGGVGDNSTTMPSPWGSASSTPVANVRFCGGHEMFREASHTSTTPNDSYVFQTSDMMRQLVTFDAAGANSYAYIYLPLAPAGVRYVIDVHTNGAPWDNCTIRASDSSPVTTFLAPGRAEVLCLGNDDWVVTWDESY